KLLPTSTDPCGQITMLPPQAQHEFLQVARTDYQISSKNSLFGRFQMAALNQPNDAGNPINLLQISRADLNARVYSAVIGNTYLIGPRTVSNFRVTANRTANPSTAVPMFSWADMGAAVTIPNDGYKFTTGNNFGGFTISSPYTRQFNSTAVFLTEDVGTIF